MLGVAIVCHISLEKSDRLWVSDNLGNLVEIDQQGNQLQVIKISYGSKGNYTVTQAGGLLYTDTEKKS